MKYLAPSSFAQWMTNNSHLDQSYGHIYRYHSRSDSHSKALCLLILDDILIAQGKVKRVLLSLEAKTCMTEHGKSQPRIFDELSSSHAIVHDGDAEAIAAGVTVVNVADRFVSPLRQVSGQTLHWTKHKQPTAAQKMIAHLRGLPIRSNGARHGFDAYTTIVISCDNQHPASLWTDAPAPQPGERDHYDTFVESIARACTD